MLFCLYFVSNAWGKKYVLHSQKILNTIENLLKFIKLLWPAKNVGYFQNFKSVKMIKNLKRHKNVEIKSTF